MAASCCGPHGRDAGPNAATVVSTSARAITSSPAALKLRPAPPRLADAARAWCPVPAGSFLMGNDGRDAIAGDGEGPVRRVALGSYQIAATTVTNAEFAEFVRDTGYITEAERLGSSFVFYLQLPPAARQVATPVASGLPWWVPVDHASWQRPEGPQSHVRGRHDHPAVHVSWNDAMAYCGWTGARLPSEAEWECAARGGLEARRFAWGDELFDQHGVPRCNVFRGDFPNRPIADWSPAPIAADQGVANGFGLFNVCGNVWEWCVERLDSDRRPLRGGSFLCHDSYCNRYRVAARSANTVSTSTSHIGFRIVRCRAR